MSIIDTAPDGHKTITANFGLDPSAVSAFNSYFHALDRAVPTCGDAPISFTRKEAENVWPGYWKSEFATDWSRPNRIEGICFVSVDIPQQVRRSLVLVGRPGETALGGKTQKTLLTVLRPHIGRMSVLAARMHHCEHRGAHFLDIIERMPYGVILLDQRGRVAHATANALAMIRAASTIRLSSGGLRANDLETDRRLRIAIAGALATFGRFSSGIAGAATIPVARTTAMAQPLILHILPLRAGLGPPSLDDDAAMVLICDPARRGSNPCKLLSQVFNLTPAEAKIAVQVAAGQGLAAVSVELGVSVNTVRTHLQHVFEKTQTRRQAELGRLVAEFTQIVLPDRAM